MNVSGFTHLVPTLGPSQPQQPAVSQEPGSAESDFGKQLAQALDQVSSVEKHADESAARFAAGQESDVHKVMLSLAKADMTMRLAVEVRNKAVEAYNELLRMQA
jgi:flagellar hook-basal body complex protein FliE